MKDGTLAPPKLRLIRSSLPHSISLETHLMDDNTTVFGNPNQIYQIVLNLCTNAIQVMKNTGGMLSLEIQSIKVASTAEALLSGISIGQYVRLRVQDTGDGMHADVLSHIFDPFFTTKKPGEGTGIGLAIVKRIINEHGGAIMVESTIGKGSVFTVYLPQLVVPENMHMVAEESRCRRVS